MESFTTTDYECIFSNFCRLIRHDSNISKYLLQLIRTKYLDKCSSENKTYFEIGPGGGLYFNEIGLSGDFKNITICEPNIDFYSNIKESLKDFPSFEFNLLNKKVLDSGIDEIGNYDICVVSHVIYYFSDQEVKELIEKLKLTRRSTFSKAFISFNTIDSSNEFGFKKICAEIVLKFLEHVKNNFCKEIEVPKNVEESKYSNVNSCSIEYYSKLIKPLSEETFDLDVYDVELKFSNSIELSQFIHFLIAENELNLKSLSVDTNISIDKLKCILRESTNLFSENFKEYPVKMRREEVIIII